MNRPGDRDEWNRQMHRAVEENADRLREAWREGRIGRRAMADDLTPEQIERLTAAVLRAAEAAPHEEGVARAAFAAVLSASRSDERPAFGGQTVDRFEWWRWRRLLAQRVRVLYRSGAMDDDIARALDAHFRWPV